MDNRLYTREDVRLHSEDGWVIINDHVYDVSSLFETHPGGPEVILEHLGHDASAAFEGAGHSTTAVILLKQMCIGAVGE
jgi:cytochrome b involved in lipid metabolism